MSWGVWGVIGVIASQSTFMVGSDSLHRPSDNAREIFSRGFASKPENPSAVPVIVKIVLGTPRVPKMAM